MEGRRPRASRFASGLSALVAMGAFALDLHLPLGISGGTPYIALPLVGLLVRSRRMILVLAAGGTVMMAAGIVLSPPGAELSVVIVNRLMTFTLLWAVTVIALRHLKVGDRRRRLLQARADTDPLTGLFNRRHVWARIDAELERYQRFGFVLSILMIDIDRFKSVNDRWGHQVGDTALRAVSDVLLRAVRQSDVVGRIGGEEFLVVLPQADIAQATMVAERIRSEVADTKIADGRMSLSVTVSLGAATVGPATDSCDALVRAADAALYRAKDQGRNCLVHAPVPELA